MGCLIPIADYYYAKSVEAQRQRTKFGGYDNRPIWERTEWSMPMRYLGGVVGFVWAASVYYEMIRLKLTSRD